MQFIDLAAQQARLKEGIDKRIQSVLAHGQYIMGPEVRELEEQLAEFCGAKHCVVCANGTDALQLALMALGLCQGDAVFIPSFTFAATAEAVPHVGATPVFVDIDRSTYNMDASSLRRAVDHASVLGLRPAAVIPVDLFGLPADYSAISEITRKHGLKIVADSAQGFGGLIDGRMTGTFGTITTTSFFPAKPLGCYGDGGALFTDDDEIATLLESLHIHGQGREKYDNVRIGMNSRLDTIQAAILLEKLSIYADEIEARQTVAMRYTRALHNLFATPNVPTGYRSIWAQYTIRAESRDVRNAALDQLKVGGVPAAVYYPLPLHSQIAYCHYPHDPAGLPESEAAAACVLSLPMHPYLNADDCARVLGALGAI